MHSVEISNWKRDDRSGIFPVGARDKQMVWSPNDCSPPLKPHYPYLFKESIPRYPDQFWTEIVAYIVAQHIGVDVPKAVPAETDIDGDTVGGALIEWMYVPTREKLVHAGDFFKSVIPNFDSALGRHHNIRDMRLLLRAIAQRKGFKGDISQWLTDMSLFDALIGNTDRHQENWGFIYSPQEGVEDTPVRISPLYDNGTSLGHERFIDRVIAWDKHTLDRYLSRGMHHLRYSRNDTDNRIQLFSLALIISRLKGSNRFRMLKKLEALNTESLFQEINALTDIRNVTPITSDRVDWIIRNIQSRYDILVQLLLNEASSN